MQSPKKSVMNEENKEEKDHQPATSSGRSKDQRRRLLVAALAGAPAIVAGSAQNAYAAGSNVGSGTN